MKYSVIHSNDPYLLARMATDLQMEGCKFAFDWVEEFHPFSDPEYYKQNYWMHIGSSYGIEFHNHGGCGETLTKDRHELTESNYLRVLESVLF